MFSSQVAWAQQGGNGSSGGTGDPGYDIMGEANPVPAPDTYYYDYVQPARDFDLVRPFHRSGLHLTAGGSGNDENVATGDNAARTAASAAPNEAEVEVAIAAGPQLYPNPAHGQLQIVAASPNTRYEYVVVVNAQGTIVQEVRSAEGVQTLNLQALSTGVYAVRLFDGKQFITQRITKE